MGQEKHALDWISENLNRSYELCPTCSSLNTQKQTTIDSLVNGEKQALEYISFTQEVKLVLVVVLFSSQHGNIKCSNEFIQSRPMSL
jgi:hypothetical protein